MTRIEEACSREVEVLLEAMFESAARTTVRAASGVFFGYDPIIGHLFVLGEDNSRLRSMIYRALAAKTRFREEAPTGWPALPVHPEAIEAAVDADDVRRRVTGMFGESLRSEDWRPEHPSVRPFVEGLLFDSDTPAEIRDDPQLRRQFSPHPLEGIAGGCWHYRDLGPGSKNAGDDRGSRGRDGYTPPPHHDPNGRSA